LSLGAMATGLARSHAWQSPCLRSTQAPMFPVPGLASALARPRSPVPRHTGRLLRRPPDGGSSQRHMKSRLSLRDHRTSRSEGRGEAIAPSTMHWRSCWPRPPSPVSRHTGRLPPRRRLVEVKCERRRLEDRPASGAFLALGLPPPALSGSLEGGVLVDTDEAAPVLAHLLALLAQLLLAMLLSGPFVFHVSSPEELTLRWGATPAPFSAQVSRL